MKEDPIFKKRFGISTPIRYVWDLEVESKAKNAYERAWKRFLREKEPCGSLRRRKRFDAFLDGIAKLQDDLSYCKRLEIRHINDEVGFGVFAKEDINPYDIINHYAGLLRPDKEIESENDSTFMFSDLPSFSIDGKIAGNMGRFMNHGPPRHPKTNVVAWEHYSKWGPRIIFTACHRGIKKGEQLLYSYGDSYWEETSFSSL